MNLLIFQTVTLYVLMEATVIAKIIRLSATTKSPIVRLSITTKSPDVNQDKIVERNHLNFVDTNHQKALVVPGGYNYTSEDTIITVGRKPLRLKGIIRLPLSPPGLNNKREKLKNKAAVFPYSHQFLAKTPDYKTTTSLPMYNVNKLIADGMGFDSDEKKTPSLRYYLPSKSLYNNDTGIQAQEDDYFDYYTKTEQQTL